MPAKEDPDIPAPALAIYHLLSSLFKYFDEEIEPRGLGLVTMDKFRVLVGRIGMERDFQETLSVTGPAAEEEQLALYNDLECQYHLVRPLGSAGVHDYSFAPPTTVGLTKAGYIKLQAVTLILEQMTTWEGGAKDTTYRFLQRCIEVLPLYRLDPTSGQKITFVPLPPLEIVNWYVSTLATSLLGITDAAPLTVARMYVSRREAREATLAAGGAAKGNGNGNGKGKGKEKGKGKGKGKQPPQQPRRKAQQPWDDGDDDDDDDSGDDGEELSPQQLEELAREMQQMMMSGQKQKIQGTKNRMAEAQMRRSAESSYQMGLLGPDHEWTPDTNQVLMGIWR